MFRFNFAHENYTSAKKVIKMIHEIEKEHGIHIKMLLDAE